MRRAYLLALISSQRIPLRSSGFPRLGVSRCGTCAYRWMFLRRRFESLRTGSTWGLPMVSKSDAPIVRSLLRKAQSISRELTEDVANARIAGTKRLSANEWAIKTRLFHCYVTVALRYMIEDLS